MVLERLINPKTIKGKPWEMFFVGIFYSFIAIILSLWIFKGYVSIVMITLTVIASIPFVYKSIEQEEIKDEKLKKEKQLLKAHKKFILPFMYLFLGFVTTFCLVYLFFPSGMVQNIFSAQIETITSINAFTGNFLNLNTFSAIFFNNMKILIFCIIFSFFYGAGAIFILTWNASVMGVAIGSSIKNGLATITGLSYFHVAGFSIMKYFLHGIPEIIAYFIAALAGGIVSVAVTKHKLKTKAFKRTFADVVYLVMIAIVILLFAALIEVFITPNLF
ncbi:MAG: stage II sporulation protein M [Nanoarchaeota archaeon]|nr:stage II sporulation protein M [Nanoarchaeota archaeon]